MPEQLKNFVPCIVTSGVQPENTFGVIVSKLSRTHVRVAMNKSGEIIDAKLSDVTNRHYRPIEMYDLVFRD